MTDKQAANKFIATLLNFPTLEGVYYRPFTGKQCFALATSQDAVKSAEQMLIANGYEVYRQDDTYPMHLVINR